MNLEFLGKRSSIPPFISGWFGQLSTSLADYWPLTIALALAVLAWVVWMLVKRHRKALTAAETTQKKRNASSLPIPVLRGINGEFRGSALELAEEPVLIGRDPKLCQLVFPAQVLDVSKRHCIVRYHAKSQCFLIVDCNSANGTFIVNGERLPHGGSQLLNAGQRFYLSDPQIMFEVNFEAPR
jgi:hypothetical protein